MDLGDGRLQLQGAPIARFRLDEPAHCLKSRAQVVVGLGERRLQRQSPPIARFGVGVVSQGPEDLAKAVMPLGLGRAETQHRAELRLRFRQSSQGLQDRAAIGTVGSDPGRGGRGTREVIDRGLQFAGLIGDHAEQVPGLGVARVSVHDLPTESLRLRGLAGLVVPHGTG